MASRATAKRTAEWRIMLRRSLMRLGAILLSALLCVLALFLALALLSYSPADPSMNTVAGPHIANLMGGPGAYASDFLLWLLGVPVGLILPLMVISGRRIWYDQDMAGWQGQIGKCLAGIFLIGLALSLFQPSPLVGLPAGWGGIAGLVAARSLISLAAVIDAGVRGWILGAVILIALGAGLLLWVRALALEKPLLRFPAPSVPRITLAPLLQLFRGNPAREHAALPEPAERAAEPRRTVDTAPKPPINIQTGTPAQKPFAPVANQDDLFGNASLPSPDLLAAPPP